MVDPTQLFYTTLIRFFEESKTSWGKVELVAQVKDLYIQHLQAQLTGDRPVKVDLFKVKEQCVN